MEQWEYMPTYIEANATKKDIKQFLKDKFGKKRPPRYMVESLMPELNRLGAEGWELVHMEPVSKLGSKGDVLFGAGYRWSNVYFCVFKRRKHLPDATPLSMGTPEVSINARQEPVPTVQEPAVPS